MPVGKGIVIAMEQRISSSQVQAIMEMWREKFGPEIPFILVPEAQIVLKGDEPILFEFTGSTITPTFVAEFQRWWEEANRDG